MPRLAPLALAAALAAAPGAAPAVAASPAPVVSTKASGGRTVHTVTRADGRRGRTIPCPRGDVLPAPSRSRVLCGRGSSWRILTLATGRSVRLFLPTSTKVANLAWSPDGDRILVALSGAGGTGSVGVTDPSTGGMVVLRTLEAGVAVGAMAWSPDSRSAAYLERSGDPQRGAARVIDVRTGADRPLLAVAGVPAGRSIDWSSRGEIAVIDGAGRIQVVRPDGSPAATLGRPAERATAVEWAPGGSRLAVQVSGRGQRWRIVERGGAVRDVRVAPTGPLAWAPDSRRLAAATSGGVALVDARGRVTRRWRQYRRITAVAWATPRSLR